MSKTKRLVGLLLALVVVAGLVAGVAFLSLGSGNKEDAGITPGIVVDGELIEEPGAMMTIGTHEVPFGIFRYFYLMLRYSFSEGDESYWAHDPDGSRAAELLDTAEEYIQYYYTWMDIAAQRGITLDADEIAEVEDAIQTQKDTYGDDFANVLLPNFYMLDEETYYAENMMEALVNKTISEVADDIMDEDYDELIAGFATARHILVKFESYEDNEAALAFAQDLLDQIEASDDPLATFEELRDEYDEDAAGQAANDGYTFGEGEMMESFYEGTMALEVDEISGLVETSYGYHIIRRLPLDEEYLESQLYNLTYNMVDAKLAAMMDEEIERLGIVYGPYWAHVSPSTVK